MVSKIILDSPRLLEESLLSITKACKMFPVPCSRAALERWIRRGSRGAVLESVLICGKRYTSKEAIDRFIHAQLRTEPDQATARKGGMSQKAIAEASRKFGLPEPIQNPNSN